MKIETKFGIGDTVYFLSPEGWNWMDSEKTRRVVEYADIERIIQDKDSFCYEVYSPEAQERLSLSENELCATEAEARQRCAVWNKLHDIEEKKENDSGISAYKDVLKDFERALDRIEKKLDLLIGKVVKA